MRFVPTKVQVFKERAATKFGFVQFTAGAMPETTGTSGGDAAQASPPPPAEDELLAAFLGFIASVQGDVVCCTLCPPSVLSALDGAAIVSAAADRLKALCLAGSRLRRTGPSDVTAQAVLDVAAFSAAELAVLRALHPSAFPNPATSDGLAEFFVAMTDGSQLALHQAASPNE